MTVVFQTFPVQNYFFFQAFQGILFIFMRTKTLQKLAIKCSNFLYNVFFYSKYRIGLEFLNFELQIFCIMNCKKINKCMGNQHCNRHLWLDCSLLGAIAMHYAHLGLGIGLALGCVRLRSSCPKFAATLHELLSGRA